MDKATENTQKKTTTICPMLKTTCLEYSCAWFGDDTDGCCAIYSMASSLGTIAAKLDDESISVSATVDGSINTYEQN